RGGAGADARAVRVPWPGAGASRPRAGLGGGARPLIQSGVRSPASAPMTKSRHYWKEIASFKDQLSQAIPLDELRSLHERDARRHLLYAARQFGIVAACGIALWHLTNPLLWVPLAVLQGFTFFNM